MKLKGLKILSGVLIILLVITMIITSTDNKKDRGNFRSELILVESSEVSGIEIIPVRNEEKFNITKTSSTQWEIKTETKKFLAQTNLVEDLLNNIVNAKAKQVVAKSKQHWEEFSVNDSLGTRVKLYIENSLVSDILVGRMSFSQSRNPYQQYPDAITYIRLADEETVYAVEGMLSITVNQSANDLRNGDMVQCVPSNVTRINFSYPGDSAFVLQKEDEVWKVNDLPADSAHTQQYLNTLRNFAHREFADKSVIQDQIPLFEIVIEGNNMEAIRIKAYLKEEDEYLVTSTLNKDTVFKLGSSEFARLFRGKSWFI